MNTATYQKRMTQNQMTQKRRLSFQASLISLFVLTGLSVVSSQASAEKLYDRIVAVVDGYPILHSEVREKVDVGPLVSVSDYPSKENDSPFKKAMNDSINFELVMISARENDIEVTEAQVDGEIDRFLQNRKLDRKGLLEFLKTQNTEFEDYRADFRNQMILRRFQGRVIAPLIKVTDKDVETYFLKKSGSSGDNVELSLRQILMRIDSKAGPEIKEAKKKLASEVHQKLKDGMPFVDAVRVYSDDEGARKSGGLMQGISVKDLSGSIRSEVENLEKGQFSNPIKTAMGLHIFYLEETKFAGSKDFAAQKDKLEFELRNVELANQTKRWLTERRQKSKVEILPGDS